MKRLRCTFLQRLLMVIVMCTTVMVQAEQVEPAVKTDPVVTNKKVNKVSYDKQTDQMDVAVEDSSLKSVLARLAQQSSIEVLFDDAADEKISVNVQANTLEDGLKQILKGRNSVMRYSRDSNKKLILVGVLVLPVGVANNGQAKSLLGMESEALSRARGEMTLDQMQKMDASTERWQARLNQLPAAKKEALVQRAEERFLKKVVAEKKRAERKQQSEKKRAEHTKKRELRREKSLQSLSPEQRAAFKEKGAASRKRMEEILLDNQ